MKTSYSRFLSSATFLSALVFAVSCSSTQVKTAEAPNTDLAKYHTYSWAPQPMSTAPQSSILDQTVKATATKQLTDKGLTEAGANPPDLLISYSAKSTTSYEYGASPGYWGWGTAYPIREGDLTLQFIDPRAKRVVWQGTAADAIGNVGATQQQISDSVKDIIKKYPG